MAIHLARVWINRTRLPILLVVSLTGKMNISLYPFAPLNLVSRDGFGSPVPRQPAHLYTKAESGGERLFAVHGLSERTTVQTSSLLLRLFFFASWPTRPISLTLTQTPTPADRVVSIHSWRPLGHSTVWADFVCVSGSVLYLVRTQSKK